LKALVELLAAMASKKAEVASPLDLFLDMCDRVVKTATGMFACKADEVAILILTTDTRHLRFAAPRKLSELGTIPISKRESIAVGVFTKKAGEVMNNVPMVRHVTFFESVKLRDKPAPIQKMITAPILLAGDVVGVAQISRKGDSPAAAGPDFTAVDLRRAEGLFESVAPYLMDARPERF
jgi:hypothetical protein